MGHARTFGVAQARAQKADGALVLRNEDLDQARCKELFVGAMYEDLRWVGLDWQEGPDVGGEYGPYDQSARLAWYREVWQRLREVGAIYPSPHSRKDVQRALSAPHEGEGEAIFPVSLRPPQDSPIPESPDGINWRFRVPDGIAVTFLDGRLGEQSYLTGKDFGDFLVWRKDDYPSYELAVVADDHAMAITEVVRGEDLLLSTVRQLLLYRALGWKPPAWYHCELARDNTGKRLAKRHDALSLRALREQGVEPSELLKNCRS